MQRGKPALRVLSIPFMGLFVKTNTKARRRTRRRMLARGFLFLSVVLAGSFAMNSAAAAALAFQEFIASQSANLPPAGAFLLLGLDDATPETIDFNENYAATNPQNESGNFNVRGTAQTDGAQLPLQFPRAAADLTLSGTCISRICQVQGDIRANVLYTIGTQYTGAGAPPVDLVDVRINWGLTTVLLTTDLLESSDTSGIRAVAEITANGTPLGVRESLFSTSGETNSGPTGGITSAQVTLGEENSIVLSALVEANFDTREDVPLVDLIGVLQLADLFGFATVNMFVDIDPSFPFADDYELVVDSAAFITNPNFVLPAVPILGVDITKLTNFNRADGAYDANVPRIAPGETVTWMYEVTNIGETPIAATDLLLTDSDPSVTPVLDIASDDGDLILSPLETWDYTASAPALDLAEPPPGITVVPGCGDGRNTYENTGRAEIAGTGIFDEHVSHYCNDVAVADVDGDGIRDEQDNCLEVANGPVIPDASGNIQHDTDGDGYGNVCDPDFNGNGVVDPFDFSLLKSRFGQSGFPDQDLNGNGIVDPFDFSRLKSMFGQPPGPSGLAP